MLTSANKKALNKAVRGHIRSGFTKVLLKRGSILLLLILMILSSSLFPSQASADVNIDNMIKCSDENGFCSFPGTQVVYFGANGAYRSATFTSYVLCTIYYFNSDPINGVKKACYVAKGDVQYFSTGAASGSAPTDSNLYEVGATVTVPDQGELERPGFTFMGWNTKVDGTGTLYPAGTTFTMGTANVRLYDWWKWGEPAESVYSGTGTADDPFQIATPVQLDKLRNYFLESGLYFKLTADMDLSDYQSGAGWEPIGGENTPFNGNLDGNGHKITNLFINRSAGYTGLFGNIGDNASVTNMKLVDVNIEGEYCVGGLACVNNGTISNIYVTGSITGGGYVGGLAGANGGAITNSYVAGSITGSFGTGGLVGGNYGPIDQSYHTGSITGTHTVGGLVGENNAPISNSYHTGSITGTHTVGGLVGENYALIDKSYAAGSVTGNSAAGGLVGDNYAAVSNSFYDSESTNQSDTGKGIGLSTLAMTKQSTYAGWDFTSTWGINASGNYGYPYLRAIQKFVTYDGNGSDSGVTPTDSSSYEQGVTASVYGNTGSLAKNGYTFAGWNTQADGTGIDYAAGTTFQMGTADVMLYAKWLSANMLLSSLSTDQGGLTPVFAASNLNYTLNVSNAVSSLHITLTKADPNAALTVTGATYSSVTGNVYTYSASDLIVGPNLIQILVTAQNETTNTYNLTVNRLSNNAELSGLALSGIMLTPAFTPGTTSYSASVGNPISSTTVMASLYDGNATMTVNGAAAASGQASSAIPLNPGTNVIPIVVTAQDGTTRTYTVTVTRAYSSSSASSGGSTGPTTSSSAVISSNGTLTLPVGKSGEVSLGDRVKIIIPADAFGKELKVMIELVADTQGLLSSKDALATPVYEVLKNFPEDFDKEITLIFTFDPSSLQGNQTPSVFFYDETNKTWVKVGGVVNGNTITVKVNHFTKFAVFGVDHGVDQGADATGNTLPPINLSDISGHWAEVNIKQAVSNGIVSGYPDGSFKPNSTITRAEFSVMLMNALKPQRDGVVLTFIDKEMIGTWAQKAVAQAVQAGIINGYEDGSFRPDAEITRSEMAAMISNALGQSIQATVTSFADDKDIPAWAKGAVSAMNKQGIIEGKGANRFSPGDKATRAEAVTVLLKMMAQKSK
ncbi:S-layer homology domain-containing protein [Paenibacillus sp. y28]|uniref:S-layer homology domain-containing protein n=1 Tax=Paenibacillus sp. y28 TaxID=3129110 RepID=UPI00301A9F9C